MRRLELAGAEDLVLVVEIHRIVNEAAGRGALHERRSIVRVLHGVRQTILLAVQQVLLFAEASKVERLNAPPGKLSKSNYGGRPAESWRRGGHLLRILCLVELVVVQQLLQVLDGRAARRPVPVADGCQTNQLEHTGRFQRRQRTYAASYCSENLRRSRGYRLRRRRRPL